MAAYKFQQQAIVAIDADRYVEAESDVRRSASVQGQGPLVSEVAIEVLAAALVAQDKDADVRAVYHSLAYNGAINPSVLLPYALLLLQNGEWVNALVIYDLALPAVDSPSILRGNYLLMTHSQFVAASPQPKKLEADIRLALGFMYDSGEHWFGRSLNYKAEQKYCRALTIDPTWPLARLAYANSLWSISRKAESKRALLQLGRLQTADVKAAVDDALFGK